jgi:hypothetical protein
VPLSRRPGRLTGSVVADRGVCSESATIPSGSPRQSPPLATKEKSASGCERRRSSAPAAWIGRQLWLLLDAFM